MKKMMIAMMILLCASAAVAETILTQEEVRRLKEARSLLMDAENRSIDDIIAEFQRTGYPREHLAIYEAIAATFRDIQKDYGKKDKASRERLLDKIRMNMAFFQFGGSASDKPGGNELNRLIQRKLKQYVPEEIWGHPKLFHSLE